MELAWPKSFQIITTNCLYYRTTMKKGKSDYNNKENY